MNEKLPATDTRNSIMVCEPQSWMQSNGKNNNKPFIDIIFVFFKGNSITGFNIKYNTSMRNYTNYSTMTLSYVQAFYINAGALLTIKKQKINTK